jgi:hypothetical protein
MLRDVDSLAERRASPNIVSAVVRDTLLLPEVNFECH